MFKFEEDIKLEKLVTKLIPNKGKITITCNEKILKEKYNIKCPRVDDIVLEYYNSNNKKVYMHRLFQIDELLLFLKHIASRQYISADFTLCTGEMNNRGKAYLIDKNNKIVHNWEAGDELLVIIEALYDIIIKELKWEQ